MTTAAELADRLGNLGLSNGVHHQPGADLDEQMRNLSLANASNTNQNTSASNPRHLITFDFPALDLLGNVDATYLPEPHLISWRPSPNAMRFHLDMWDPIDLFCIMDTEALTFDASTGYSQQALCFLNAIEGLAASNGNTTMSVVTHVSNGMAEVLIRLSTSHEMRTTRTTFWDLSVTDWEAIMAIPRPWIEVLGDVVYRKTTRSFLAAEEKLKQHSLELQKRDTARWANEWGTGAPRSAKCLLMDFLRRLHSNTILGFDNLEEDGNIQLPCGHDVFIPKQKIDAMTEDMCRDATCIFCNARVLPVAEYEEAKMFVEYFEVYEASSSIDGWARLHEWIKDDSLKSFDKNALLLAIPAAMNSLKLPESIESKRVSPITFTETAISLEAMNQWLSQQGQTIRASPLDLVNKLEDVAIERLVDTDVALWQTFLKVALNRAVNLATLKRCSKLGEEHLGVHKHGRFVFVNVTYEPEGDE